MSAKKEVRQLLQWAAGRGWDSSLTSGGHYKLRKPGCETVITSSSPKKSSAIANCRARIKRAERNMQTVKA